LIDRVERRWLDDRLRDENAVKRIAVQQGQPADKSSRVRAERQFGEPGIECGSGNLGGVERKIAAAKSGLDGDLPNAGGAEQYLGFAAFDRGARLTIQPAGLGERPKQNACRAARASAAFECLDHLVGQWGVKILRHG